MATPQPILPREINTDISSDYIKDGVVRFIKNLTLKKGANGDYVGALGHNEEKQKPLQANELYAPISMPEGDNFPIGGKWFDKTNEAYIFVYNSLANHFIYRINCGIGTVEIVKINPDFNFQLSPEYFIHENGCELEVDYLVNPDTGEIKTLKQLFWTDGFNPQGYLVPDDCIATGGFDATKIPYFTGTYDNNIPFRLGLPTLNKCITIAEVPHTGADDGLSNDLLFTPWQFRIQYIDVWGRPSEHTIISEPYYPQINDCIATSSNLSRAIDLTFEAGSPFINLINIEYRFGNNEQWYVDKTLFLYNGSNIGDWWTRQRNTDINSNPSIYNSSANTITYRFYRNQGQDPISVNETNRVKNPIPYTSKALFSLNKKIVLANNKEGSVPFSQDLKSKITASVTPPTESFVETRNITIYVPIWHQTNNDWNQVQKDGTNGYTWGNSNNAREFSQYFKNINQSGFGGYLVGSGYAISTQVYLDGSGQLVDDPELNGRNLSPTQFTMQKFVFNSVPPGVYIFRLMSHLADPTSVTDYQNTSTTVWGLCPFIYNGTQLNVNTNGRLPYQELIIDARTGDYNTLNDSKILCISDMSQSGFKATCGYIYETKRNGYNQNPMELMSVTGGHGMWSIITDHNGFYWFSTEGSGRTYSFKFYNKCASAEFTNGEGNANIMRFINYFIDEIGNPVKWPDYSTTACNRVLITGRCVLNNSTIGVPNITVCLTRGATAITDDNGNFTIIAHDMFTGGVRNDSIILTNGTCSYTDANGDYLNPVNIIIDKCVTCGSIRNYPLPGSFVLTYKTEKSLLSGGTYGVCCQGYDWLDRGNAAQFLGYINIPSIITSKSIGASKVQITIDPTALFPKDVKYITFGITPETTMSTYLSWIVDRCEFIDNTGQINIIAPTQIRIYYASINEYNKQNNFSTTTAWQFIATGTSSPIVGDKIQFFINGDGTFFTKTIISLVKYDNEGSYFLVDYTSELANLTSNAYIRLIRPKTITGNEPFFEICDSRVDIVDGRALKNSLVLNAYDTFYLSRQIPVPTPLSPIPVVTTTTQTSTPVSGTVITSVQAITSRTTTNESRIFGFRFEHHAVSNFWGDNVFNYGRPNYKNPYEGLIENGEQVALSGEMSSNGQLNYLNYFDDNLKVVFNVQNMLGITGVLVMSGRIRFVCQHGNFLVGWNDNLLRQNNDGTLSTPSAQNGFGQPERIEDSEYGCLERDKNTIGINGSEIVFLDSTLGELVGFGPRGTIHFTKGRHDIIFIDKLKSIVGTNRFFHKGINPLTGEYLLTDFNLDSFSYMNQERWYNADVNETLSFDMATGIFLGVFSFTPELYIGAASDEKHKQLFSFKGAMPYNHYNIKENSLFNTFYGETCERVLVIVHNGNLLEEKSFKWIEVYSKFLYFSPKITTDSGQLSRLNKSQWLRTLKFYKGSFLSDLRTPDVNNIVDNKLFNGNKLYGKYAVITLVGDSKNNNQYSELSGIIVFSVPIEKSGAK